MPLQPTASAPLGGRRFLPILLVLFVGSGAAALIYEIVWFQLIQLVIGSSAVSLAVLLGTFMGGMCLGSLLLPRLIPVRAHPLKVYGLLELGIAACAIIVLFGLPYAGGLYAQIGGPGTVGLLLRALLCVLVLLPPTMMMGATLPAMSRWLESTREGISWMGFFYGGNIAGAVFGCLLAGFYLLRVHDMATATLAGMGLNVAVGLVGIGLARMTNYAPTFAGDADAPRFDDKAGARQLSVVHVVIALSGFTALGAEVIWTRILSLLLGATVYTFSIILAVFLIGLGLGSAAGSVLARKLASPRLALGWCQLLLTVGIAWTAYTVSRALPYWPINVSLAISPWFNFQIDFVRCLWAALPPAILWGASFPLAVAAAAAPGQDPGRLVGGVYSANTVGAIFGALVASVIAVPELGTRRAQGLLMVVAVVSALLCMLPLTRADSGAVTPGAGRRRVVGPAGLAAVLVVAALGLFLAYRLPGIPGVLVAYGRYAPTYGEPTLLYSGEGMNSTVAVSELAGGIRNFHVSGKIEASTEPQDMRLQRMLGHISALLHPQPETVLIVGFGAGVTAGSFVLHPSVKRIVICEIEPLIPGVIGSYFSRENYDILNDPRVEVVYDDARHYILTTDEKFDVITSDPINPWVKGAATLYTREYFDLVKRHLNPGGVITQWVPLYESDFDVVRSEIATFFDVFPEGTIWRNDLGGSGYDVLLAGINGPAKIDVDSLQARLARPDHQAVAASLREVTFATPFDLLATYGGRGPDLAPWLEGAEINRDRNLRLQYLAGMGSNLYRGGPILNEMMGYWRYPEDLFVTSPEARQELDRAWPERDQP